MSDVTKWFNAATNDPKTSEELLPLVYEELRAIETDDGYFGLRTNRLGFNVTGPANSVVVIEASTNLSGASLCEPVSTNILIGGACYFSDPSWANFAGRFYRVLGARYRRMIERVVYISSNCATVPLAYYALSVHCGWLRCVLRLCSSGRRIRDLPKAL